MVLIIVGAAPSGASRGGASTGAEENPLPVWNSVLWPSQSPSWPVSTKEKVILKGHIEKVVIHDCACRTNSWPTEQLANSTAG